MKDYMEKISKALPAIIEFTALTPASDHLS